LRVQRKEIERTYYENMVGFVGRYLSRDLPVSGRRNSGATPTKFEYPLGQMKIGDLTEAHVEEFRGAVADLGYAKSTIANASTALGMLLGWAKLHRYTAVNVARGGRRTRGRQIRSQRLAIPEKET